MIKKRQSHNQVQLEKKKKYPNKPVNQGYLIKLANRVIDSTKFNNLVFLKKYFLFN
jgi:hypothetical protein